MQPEADSAAPDPVAASDQDRALARLVDEVLARSIEFQPELGTFLGFYERDGELGEYSADSFRAQEDWSREMLARLRDEIDRSRLGHASRIDYDLLRTQLETELWLSDHAEQKDWEREPSTYVQLPTAAIYTMTVRDYAPAEERAANIVERARQFPRVLEHGILNLKNPPRLWTEIAAESARASVPLFEAYLPAFLQPFPGLAGEYASFQAGLSEALSKYIMFLHAELTPRSTGSWSDGAERFNYRLRERHLLDADADGLIAFGQKLLSETEAAMTELAAAIAPGRGWKRIVEESKLDHPAADSLLDTYRIELERAREFVSARDLVTLPAGERARVIETPPPMRNTIPYAAYDMPPVFADSDEGLFYVTPVAGKESMTRAELEEKLRGHPRASIEVTTVHEAYPGHHVQLVHQKKARSSKMRKLAFSTVLIEGWALYCEELMHEQGYYSSERVRLVQLKDLLWRACRVVVDASLHTGRMSFGQAADLLVERAAIEPSNAIAEVKRYTQSPTQPMSYAVGRQSILDLRDAYRESLGPHFDLKSFHDELLDYGSLPPPIIAREMLAKLEAAKRKGR